MPFLSFFSDFLALGFVVENNERMTSREQSRNFQPTKKSVVVGKKWAEFQKEPFDSILFQNNISIRLGREQSKIHRN